MLRLEIVDIDLQGVLARAMGLFEELAADKSLKLDMTVDAGGTTDNVASSVWALKCSMINPNRIIRSRRCRSSAYRSRSASANAAKLNLCQSAFDGVCDFRTSCRRRCHAK